MKLSGLDVTQYYGYDPVNRLLTAEEKRPSDQAPQGKLGFTYDRYDNRNFDSAFAKLMMPAAA